MGRGANDAHVALVLSLGDSHSLVGTIEGDLELAICFPREQDIWKGS